MKERKYKIGTHNSATGEKGKGLLSCLVTPFTRCQSRSIEAQYKMGCRYFDLRVVLDKKGVWRFAHGLWTSEKSLLDILRPIRTLGSCDDKAYISFTLERGEPYLCEALKRFVEYYTCGDDSSITPTYIAYKHPKWTIYHTFNDVPCVQGFLPLDGHSWHTYLPLPWLWKKIYHNHPEFNAEQYTLVDFL